MGIDLPDLNEIISAIKGDHEPLKQAWRDFVHSLDDKGEELKQRVIAEIRELSVDALIDELYPNCPSWLRPIVGVGARAIVNIVLKKLEKV